MTVFTGNSLRGWIVSTAILLLATGSFIVDVRMRGGIEVFTFLDILIFVLVILWWRTKVTFTDSALEIDRLTKTVIPYSSIERLVVVWNPINGYVASLEYLPDSGKTKRWSFFVGHFKEPYTFIARLQEVLPQRASLNLCKRLKQDA